MFDFTKSDKFLWLEAAKERKIRSIGKNSDTAGVSPAKENKTNWIDGYFSNLTCRVAKETRKYFVPLISVSEIKEPSINLWSSLDMFVQEAACDADNWADVNCRYNDRRSFPALLNQISLSGLDKYASKKDNDINIGYETNTWSFSETSPDGLDNLMKLPQRIRRDSARSLNLMLMKPSQVVTDKYNGGSLSIEKLLILTDSFHDVTVAERSYIGCLSLKELSQIICLESGDDFKREQAGLLESFLDPLIKIQQEQRFVADSFFEHLQQLKNCAFSSNAVDDDGDRHMCPLILRKHNYIWRQKHIFDSLCTMSRESVWLLKTLKDSYFSSPSSIKEFDKILDIILAFVSKFKKSKVLLDQYLFDESFRNYVDPRELVKYTKEKLGAFGERVRHLQEQGVERKSVAETLLGCFVDVLDVVRYLYFFVFTKETSVLIKEAVEKLNSVRYSDLTAGGSPLGCIALWRILFESSLINLRLDLICKTVEVEVKPCYKNPNDDLNHIRPSIDDLMTVGKNVLAEFISIHKTVGQVTYMLGDAFTTGGAGMNDTSDVTHLKNFNLDDFPWDMHNLSPRIENTMNWTDCVEDDG